MKPLRPIRLDRRSLTWLLVCLVFGVGVPAAYTLLAPARWPLFTSRYRILKFWSMNGYEFPFYSMELRHPLYVEAIANDIGFGTREEALWACDMGQAMFMRSDFLDDAEILARLETPVVQLLERETDPLVRAGALGLVGKSDKLAQRVRGEVVQSLKSGHLLEAYSAAQVAAYRMQEESLARPLITSLLESDQDYKIRLGLRFVGTIPDLSPYKARLEKLQLSTNPALWRSNFEIKRRLDMETESHRESEDRAVP